MIPCEKLEAAFIEAAKTCPTCNASYQNTVERVTRCGLCVATPTGNTKWQPGAVQHPQQEQPK